MRVGVVGIFSIFIIGNPLAIHLIAKKYVTELYWNPASNVFTAHTLSFFATKKVLHFFQLIVRISRTY